MNSISEPPYGDRRQELVVIGHDLDEAEFRLQVDACLLTDEEFEACPEARAKLEDLIPAWQLVVHDHAHRHHGHDHWQGNEPRQSRIENSLWHFAN